MVSEQEDRIAGAIVDSALTVHRRLGPGLLESVYELCLFHELTKRSIQVERQVGFPIHYDDLKIESGLRLDLLGAGLVIVEIKAVEKLAPVHQAQLLTYLKLTDKKLGLLINFNVPLIKDGIKRMVM
jgi:GxxExxY protein